VSPPYDAPLDRPGLGDGLARTRLPPEERRSQIIQAAQPLLVDQGYLPLPPEELGRRAGVSKALIYRYFPSQGELINAVLAAHAPLFDAIDAAAARPGQDDEAFLTGCAEVYFEHVAEHGPLLHLIFADRYASERIGPAMAARQRGTLRRLARRARASLGLDLRQCLAAVGLFAAMVEEAGTLAFRRPAERERASEVCRTLLVGALDGLRKLDHVEFGSTRSELKNVIDSKS
jgi:AcrR family transcriptional regulator